MPCLQLFNIQSCMPEMPSSTMLLSTNDINAPTTIDHCQLLKGGWPPFLALRVLLSKKWFPTKG